MPVLQVRQLKVVKALYSLGNNNNKMCYYKTNKIICNLATLHCIKPIQSKYQFNKDNFNRNVQKQQ